MKGKIIYSVVVPLFNEELVIKEGYSRLTQVMEKAEEKYEIIFVNDGSVDETRNIAEKICEEDDRIELINFSRNFGHQAAITAGMEAAVGEAIIVIDGDLQDPPEAMLDMIKKWKEGYQVVYGKRLKREGETIFKKITAKIFYRVLKSMTTVDIPVDTGDFRLIDRKVCNALIALPEKNRYIRGLVSWLGFKQTYVEFVRKERFAGETKYSFKKMMKLAMDGITSFSSKPLTIAGYFGGILSLIGFISTIILMLINISKGVNILSLGMLLSINIIFFGLIFISIGIMGQYLGKIYDESKGRPMYITESRVSNKEREELYEVRRKCN